VDVRKWMVGALALVAAVATLGLLAVSVTAIVALDDDAPDPEGSQNLTAAPVEAIVDLSESGKRRWGDGLGKACNLDKVYVIALEQDSTGVDVVSFPGDCDLSRFHVSWEDGSVRPEDPIALGGGGQ
jgi:hypothetical protein